MFSQVDIRDGIKQEFPCFQSKQRLQDYYMSYQYPAQQQKLFQLWRRLLMFICRSTHRLVFSRKALSELLIFYGMKPLPLDNIIRQLVKDRELFEKSKYAQVYEKEEKKEKEGVVSKVWGYLFSSKVEEALADQYFWKGMVDEAVAVVKKEAKAIFKGQTALLEEVVVDRVQAVLGLRGDGEFLLEVLLCLKIFLRVSSSVDGNKITLIVYSDDPSRSLQRIAQQSKIQFCLHHWQHVLSQKINLKYKKMQQILLKVKQCLRDSNKSLAKQYLQQAKLQQQALSKLMLRKRILTKQINKIQQSQSNIDMVKSLEQSQNLLRTMEVDVDKVASLAIDAEDIQRNRDEVQKIFEGIAGTGGQEEEELFRRLEREVEQDNSKKVAPQLVNVPLIKQQEKQLNLN